MPNEMFAGEVQSCLVHLINTSSTHAINRIRLATSQPNLIAMSSSEDHTLITSTDDIQSQWNHSLTQHSPILTLANQPHLIQANSTRTIRLWLHAAHAVGEMNIDFLFLYESDGFQQPLR